MSVHENNGWQARIERDADDVLRGSVTITVARRSKHPDDDDVLLTWAEPEMVLLPRGPAGLDTADVPEGRTPSLTIREDVARALYETLADHFGHTLVDTRMLRRDYEAERGRVDRLIGFLTGGRP